MSRRAPWPRAAKVTVAALAVVFGAIAVLSGARQDTSNPSSGSAVAAVSTTSTSTTSTTAAPPTTSAPPTTAAAPVITTAARPETTSASAPVTTSTTAVPPAQGRAANRPDPTLSPGVADPAVTQASIHQTICVSGYTSTVRNVPQSEKGQVYAEYGITHHAPGEYEIDHLISLELGGSNDIHNLWPEPYGGPDNAHTKDGMENRLHAEVCDGRLTLAQGQDEIVHWWMYE